MCSTAIRNKKKNPYSLPLCAAASGSVLRSVYFFLLPSACDRCSKYPLRGDAKVLAHDLRRGNEPITEAECKQKTQTPLAASALERR